LTLRFEEIDLLSSAGFTTLLLVCVLMQGFALVLGRARGLSRRGTAEDKALALLKQWLSPAQLAQYEHNGHFEVTGCYSGKRYRIRHGLQMNIDELDEHGAGTASWCFGPEGHLPIGDVMLAQKIALENDEQTTLAVANRGHRQQWPPGFE
jgi:hypothetical protein